jgi:hypothetical protein
MPRQLSFRALITAALLANVLSIYPLYGHSSDPATVLGRYSTRYALVLAVHLTLTAVYALAWVFAGRLQELLRWLPRSVVWVGCALAVGAALATWTTSLAFQVQNFLSLSALLVVVVVAVGRGPHPKSLSVNREGASNTLPRTNATWGVPTAIMGITVLALTLPLFLTALTVQGYHPDEAHYTDYASTFMAEGMLYDSAWLETPYTIEPGWPWQLAAYGWLLEQVGYTVYVGRVVNFVAYLLCFAGLYAVGARLYGRAGGVLAAGTALLSIAFIPEWDYSPNHLLTPVGAWTLYLLLVAHESSRRDVQLGGYALVGLLATLSLNVHSAGVVFALGYTLWVVWGVGWAWFGRRGGPHPLLEEGGDSHSCNDSLPNTPSFEAPLPWGEGFRVRASFSRMIAFGFGATLGTVTFYFTNITPVGGFGPYLAVLTEWDGAQRHPLFFVRWESLFERVLIALAIVWLAWRRTRADRFVLSAVGFMVVSAWLLDTQGYIWHYGPFYFLALSALLTEALPRQRTLLVAGTALVMAAQVSSAFIDWGTVRQFARTGTVPTYLYNDLKAVVPPYIREDDVVYTTHQLIWLYPHTREPRIVTYGAEAEGIARFGLDSPEQVWEQVEPTVIVFVDGQMSFDPGMIAYMVDNPFAVCAALEVQGTPITIYRRDGCERPNPAPPLPPLAPTVPHGACHARLRCSSGHNPPLRGQLKCQNQRVAWDSLSWGGHRRPRPYE